MLTRGLNQVTKSTVIIIHSSINSHLSRVNALALHRSACICMSSTCALTRCFRSSMRCPIFSLDYYSGEVGSLLAHNEAGKTIAASILVDQVNVMSSSPSDRFMTCRNIRNNSRLHHYQGYRYSNEQSSYTPDSRLLSALRSAEQIYRSGRAYHWCVYLL
jgi:hypothetical protein